MALHLQQFPCKESSCGLCLFQQQWNKHICRWWGPELLEEYCDLQWSAFLLEVSVDYIYRWFRTNIVEQSKDFASHLNDDVWVVPCWTAQTHGTFLLLLDGTGSKVEASWLLGLMLVHQNYEQATHSKVLWSYNHHDFVWSQWQQLDVQTFEDSFQSVVIFVPYFPQLLLIPLFFDVDCDYHYMFYHVDVETFVETKSLYCHAFPNGQTGDVIDESKLAHVNSAAAVVSNNSFNKGSLNIREPLGCSQCMWLPFRTWYLNNTTPRATCSRCERRDCCISSQAWIDRLPLRLENKHQGPQDGENQRCSGLHLTSSSNRMERPVTLCKSHRSRLNLWALPPRFLHWWVNWLWDPQNTSKRSCLSVLVQVFCESNSWEYWFTSLRKRTTSLSWPKSWKTLKLLSSSQSMSPACRVHQSHLWFRHPLKDEFSECDSQPGSACSRCDPFGSAKCRPPHPGCPDRSSLPPWGGGQVPVAVVLE